MSKSSFGVLAVVLALGFLAAPAMAQPLHSQPASLLVYPLYNSTDGNNTLLTVTNTNESEISCGNGFRQGDIQAHFVYFSETCQESNTQEDLTPADTITVLARGHNPNFEKGFLVVEARDPENLVAAQYDFLIGSAIVVNSEFDFQWSYTPYAFRGIFAGVADFDACGRPILLADNGQIDFDGVEYDTFPEILYLDNFFGEGTPDSRPAVDFGNMIFLMSTTSSQTEDTNVSLLGWNNNERRFSRTFSFNCYFMGALSDLTQAVTQANLDVDSDDDELVGVETGWLKLRSTNQADHALLGVFVHSSIIGGDSFVAGRELQYTGSRVADLPRFF